MKEEAYTIDELLILYQAGDLRGQELASFEEELASNSQLRVRLEEYNDLDLMMTEALTGKDEMPQYFRNDVQEKLSQSKLRGTNNFNPSRILQSIFSFRTLLPAGAGAALSAILIGLAGPSMVMRGEESQGRDFFSAFHIDQQEFDEKKWMLEMPAFARVVLLNEDGSYNRDLGKGLNKVSVGERFFIYVSVFQKGRLEVKTANISIFEEQVVDMSSIVEISNDESPWEFVSPGRDRVDIIFNGVVLETIVFDVE